MGWSGVRADRLLRWVTLSTSNPPTVMDWFRVDEMAALQTFDTTYILPEAVILGMRLVGNAVPPRVAQLLLTP